MIFMNVYTQTTMYIIFKYISNLMLKMSSSPLLAFETAVHIEI